MLSPKTPWLLFTLISVYVVSIALTLSIVLSVRPDSAGPVFHVTLLFAVFTFLTLTLGVCWHALRKKLNKLRVHRTPFWVSLRQAALGSIVIVISLYLSSLNVLGFWDLLALVTAAILIEFFFLAEKSHASQKFSGN